jgi:glycosyltransferase involved in cell wall biosynthesis
VTDSGVLLGGMMTLFVGSFVWLTWLTSYILVLVAVAAVDGRVRVLSYRPNRGRWFAVRTGMLAARGELVVFTDADGSYQPSDLDRVVGHLPTRCRRRGTRRPAGAIRTMIQAAVPDVMPDR